MEPVAGHACGRAGAVKAAPADASARMKLFRVFCLTGQWDRAVIQLDTASGMDAELAMTSLRLQAGDRLRAVPGGGLCRQPHAGGGGRAAALARLDDRGAQGRAGARAVAARAGDGGGRQACPGSLNGEEFEWLADADPRLGPVCEAFIDGKYYWLPFDRIAELDIEPPDDLIDLVWTRAELVLGNGGSKPVLVPTRYPGSEASDDDAIRTGRRTEWIGSDETGYRGLGQREWVTDHGERR